MGQMYNRQTYRLQGVEKGDSKVRVMAAYTYSIVLSYKANDEWRSAFLSSAPGEFVSLAEMECTLLKNLFQGYQRWVRPTQHANDTVTVRFGLKISQLVDVVRPHGAHAIKAKSTRFTLCSIFWYTGNLKPSGIFYSSSILFQ